MSNKRASQFELLRIICMLLIIMNHMIMVHNDNNEASTTISLLLRSFTRAAVDAFVIISGYFGIKFKAKKLAKLLTQTWFYSVTSFLLVVFLLNLQSFTINKDFLAFFPTFSRQYWFVTVYIGLYCISPFLNKFIESSSKKTLQKFLIVGVVLFYIWPTAAYLVNARHLVEDSGYGIVNFSYLYILGRYLNLHFIDKHNCSWHFRNYLIIGIVLFISQYIISHILGFEFSAWFSYDSIFVLIAAVSLFLCFKHLKIQSSKINALAAPCIAIYLFHYSPYVWDNFTNYIGLINAPIFLYITSVFSLPIIIYLLGVVIENIREKCLKKPEEWLGNSTEILIEKIQKVINR